MRTALFCYLLASALLLQSNGSSMHAQQPPAAGHYSPVVHLTSEQDRQRTMDLLHITALRPGVNGDPAAPHGVNYDEAKVGVIAPLPNPLVMQDGRKVTSAKMWRTQRRPELVELFDREIYGRAPAHTPSVHWVVTSTKDVTIGETPAITRTLEGHVDNSDYPLITVTIKAEVTVPAHTRGPVPAMIELSFLGLLPPGIKLPPPPPGPSWQEQLLRKGWGYALYNPYSVQADNGAGLTEGIIGLCNHGQPRELEDWGALRAWAWGASRLLDYFASGNIVDAMQVGIDGHSRFGKAALVAEAFDQRFAIGYISSSGAGGAKLLRRNFGESLENIAATNEYHWMAGNFLKYAGPLQVSDMPVDAHELIALCAPRPVFVGAGAVKGDGWVDARGMFEAEVAASPVYALFGLRGLGSTTYPPMMTADIDGTLGFRQHNEGHTPLPNWPTFIRFASRYLHPPQ